MYYILGRYLGLYYGLSMKIASRRVKIPSSTYINLIVSFGFHVQYLISHI